MSIIIPQSMKRLEQLRPKIHRDNTCAKISVIVIGSVICISSPGVFYGWSALLLVLEDSGVYSDRCNVYENGTSLDSVVDADCPDRLLAFNLIFSIVGVVNPACAIVHGYLTRRFGSRLNMLINSVFWGTGIYINV